MSIFHHLLYLCALTRAHSGQLGQGSEAPAPIGLPALGMQLSQLLRTAVVGEALCRFIPRQDYVMGGKVLGLLCRLT
jgi:hypothetical protein